MRPHGPTEPEANFQGMLLVAHPGLKDPNFRRAVLFLSAHEPDAGTFGLILNRPLAKPASHLLPEHDRQDLLSRVPVYVGGPVGQTQLSFADLNWDEEKDRLQLHFNLSLEEVAERKERGSQGLRAFVGYAGWSTGQLEGELEQKAWILTRPEPGSLTPDGNLRLWRNIMNSLGPDYKLLAAAPDDPSLN